MNRILTLLFLSFPTIGFAQLGVAFHQSNIPFIGINYEINGLLRPEIRIGTDNYFDDTSIEAIITYDIFDKDNYEFYAGIGGRVNNFSGVVIPVGLNIYPFTFKNFGFHIELAPIIGDLAILRGSWGIRYRFN